MKEKAIKIQKGELKAPDTVRVNNLETPKMHGLVTDESGPPSPTGLSSRPLLANPSIQNTLEDDENQGNNLKVKGGPIPISLEDPGDDDTKAVEDGAQNILTKSYLEVEEIEKALKDAALWKSKVPLEEFLLYFAFYETADSHIPRMALEILN